MNLWFSIGSYWIYSFFERYIAIFNIGDGIAILQGSSPEVSETLFGDTISIAEALSSEGTPGVGRPSTWEGFLEFVDFPLAFAHFWRPPTCSCECGDESSIYCNSFHFTRADASFARVLITKDTAWTSCSLTLPFLLTEHLPGLFLFMEIPSNRWEEKYRQLLTPDKPFLIPRKCRRRVLWIKAVANQPMLRVRRAWAVLVQRRDVTGHSQEIEMAVAGSRLCFSRPTDRALVVILKNPISFWTMAYILNFCPNYFRQRSGLVVHHPLQAGRVVRLLRLVRLIRLVKFYQKNTSSPKYKKGEDGAEALGAGRAVQLDGSRICQVVILVGRFIYWDTSNYSLSPEWAANLTDTNVNRNTLFVAVLFSWKLEIHPHISGRPRPEWIGRSAVVAEGLVMAGPPEISDF